MEFKRIDDTKFQCLLDEDDLEDNNISLDDFFRNDTKKIHGLLDVILEEAQKSIGIMMDGGVMSLCLAPQPNSPPSLLSISLIRTRRIQAI
ncbi:MAG: adaptor protein MecA [Lachnospira sp.]